MRFRDLQNCHVAILGGGREGQAVWRQLRRRFPDKPVSIFAESDIDGQFASLLTSGLDTFHRGPFDVELLENFDVLVRSAGISPYRDELQQLRSRGLRFTTASNLWFAENPDAKTICISGTMGKSTTAALTFHLMKSAGVKACLAGNIGRPMLDCDNRDVDWWVIELSSYQLCDLEADPEIALLLNLSEEHVDWHGGLLRYQSDKLRLAELAVNGCLVANFTDPVLAERLARSSDVTWFNHDETWRVGENAVTSKAGRRVSAPASLPGQHNLQNLAAVLTVLEQLDFQIPDLEEALSTFTGLPHRLQLLGEKAGIRYVDDSISTTPVSVSTALQTIGHADVVLLLGGMDRGLDWQGFTKELAGQLPYAIITLPDNGPRIYQCLVDGGIELRGGLHQSSNLEDAVSLSQTLVPPGGCVLLSPGAPSFPHFKDYEDRGNQFKKYAGIENGVQSAH